MGKSLARQIDDFVKAESLRVLNVLGRRLVAQCVLTASAKDLKSTPAQGRVPAKGSFPGHYVHGFYSEIVVTSRGLGVKVGNHKTGVSAMLESGNKPKSGGLITARNSGVLRFKNPSGKWVSTKSVKPAKDYRVFEDAVKALIASSPHLFKHIDSINYFDGKKHTYIAVP
jgi:hypothetical protein